MSREGLRVCDAEQGALAALDEAAMVELVRELITMPSLDGDESPAQERVAAWLSAQGFATDLWEIDLEALAEHPDYSHEVERGEALGVVGWSRPDGEDAGGGGERRAGRDLLLNGHIDVVPAGDEAGWTTGPWTAAVRDGRIYGRGACDMKGGLAAALFAAKAVRDAAVPLAGRVGVASVAGEEEGGLGTLAALLRGHTADGAIVTEPTRLAVVVAEAGSIMFRLTVEGRAAHGSVREQGVSAIEKFLPLFQAIRALEGRRCDPRHWEGKLDDSVGALFRRHRLPWPIEAGTLRAGDWGSSVPQTLVCEGRYGFPPGEDEAAARRAFEEAIAAAASSDPWLCEHPPRVEWWGGRFAPAATDPTASIVTTLRTAAEAVIGRSAPLEAVTYGSDLRLLTNVGRIPAVLFGPGDVRDSHMPDESVAIDELLTAARVLIVTAVRFCGLED